MKSRILIIKHKLYQHSLLQRVRIYLISLENNELHSHLDSNEACLLEHTSFSQQSFIPLYHYQHDKVSLVHWFSHQQVTLYFRCGWWEACHNPSHCAYSGAMIMH